MIISPTLTLEQHALLPTPQELFNELPISAKQSDFIFRSRMQVREILDGHDPRLLLICGPCSIHDYQSAIEYAEKIFRLSKIVQDRFLLIMRVYFDKPRTVLGWPGFATDPHLDGSDDINTGIKLTRKLLIALSEMQVPTAAELLNPFSPLYFGDLLSWGCIGARTTESQTHRQIAASVPLPMAFKNNTSGSIQVAINGAIAASSSHSYIGINAAGQPIALRTEGNNHTHIVLRGSDRKPNYDADSVKRALNQIKKAKLARRILIDCSHGNSQRQHEKQIDVFKNSIDQIDKGNRAIRGLILESHINGGNQPWPSQNPTLKYATSITDPCLDWENTERLILWGYNSLANVYSDAN